jgi:hypothetical protein
MLSSVLNSERAVQMNIVIMRAFVRMRKLLTTHKDLAEKIEKLERTQKQHGSILVAVVQDIQKLKTPPPQSPRCRIGFHVPEEKYPPRFEFHNTEFESVRDFGSLIGDPKSQTRTKVLPN